MPTCNYFLLDVGEHFKVNETLHNALHGSELRIKSECEEHHEEQDSPKVSRRELIHSLCKVKTKANLYSCARKDLDVTNSPVKSMKARPVPEAD